VTAVRDATAADAGACAAIYAPFVTGTGTSFEDVPPGPAEMAGRIAGAHAWLVLVDGSGAVAGYAYAVAHRSRAAYRWACEVSVYLDPAHRGRGGGRALYTALLDRLAGRGFRTALAIITLPNEPSERLHRALGFVPVGVCRRVGWKHGRWHDVLWMQRELGDVDDGPPVEPV
jgi:L-amino acid N-acyltransferase YncA